MSPGGIHLHTMLAPRATSAMELKALLSSCRGSCVRMEVRRELGELCLFSPHLDGAGQAAARDNVDDEA